MIFYLNLFKAIKFVLKVINMNRPAPNLQLGLGGMMQEVVPNNTFFLLQAQTVPSKTS